VSPRPGTAAGWWGRVVLDARWTAREPLIDEVADIAADEHAAGLVGRRYVRRVVYRDRVLISELCGAAEQSSRGRYDPAVARDAVDGVQQQSDTVELAPASNRHVRNLVTCKIERSERDLGIGE
jgi:hypothetical protein